jgi:predicted TIM-barrel fold metal-dependent hydrolase
LVVGIGGCASAGGGGGLKRTEEETLAAGPRYEGPLVDCHSHVIQRMPPGVAPLDEATLVRALGENGIDRGVAFGAAGGRSSGSRLVPVLALGGDLPSRSDLRALLSTGDYRGIKMSVRHFPFPMQPRGINGRADSGAVQEIAAAAADTGWPLTLHLDGPDVADLARLCTAVPRAAIVWAHAGTTPPQFGGGAPPATVARMLDSHPGLHVDLSARAPGWMGPLGR